MLGRYGRPVAAAVLTLACALGAASCGSDDAGGGASAGSAGAIKVGAIVSASGPRSYGAESAEGAKAFFAELNADGGIGGRKVEYLIEDDGGNPSKAAAAARKLVGKGVVAIVGGASTIECQANAPLYAQRNVTDIIALPSNPLCFTSPNIVPLTSGPVLPTLAAAEYAIKELGKKRIQFIAVDAPSGQSADAPVQAYLKQNDASAGPTEFVAMDQDPTPALVRSKGRDPDAIVYLFPPPKGAAMLEAQAQQGMPSSRLTTLSPATGFYDPALPKAIGDAAEGLISFADYRPLEDQHAAVREWSASVAEHGTTESRAQPALTAGGWTAAAMFAEAAKTIRDDVTAEAVSAAINKLSGFENGLLAGPLTVAGRKPGLPISRSLFVLKVEDGKWTLDQDTGVRTSPPAGFELPSPPSNG